MEAAAIYHPSMELTGLPVSEKIAGRLRLRQDTLNRLTGFSLRAIAGWSNVEEPSTPVKCALIEMDRLLDSLGH
jgi:hypothetical protein